MYPKWTFVLITWCFFISLRALEADGQGVCLVSQFFYRIMWIYIFEKSTLKISLNGYKCHIFITDNSSLLVLITARLQLHPSKQHVRVRPASLLLRSQLQLLGVARGRALPLLTNSGPPTMPTAASQPMAPQGHRHDLQIRGKMSASLSSTVRN